jgi:predicted dehydrogenase
MKFGLIGASVRGMFLSSLATENGHEFCCVADPGEDMRTAAVDIFKRKGMNLRAYETDAEMMAKEPEIDAVFIGSGDQWHYANMLAALPYEKAIYVEKPLAQQVSHCDEILALWKKHPAVVCGGLELRHSVLNEEAIRLLEEGVIGKVVLVSAYEGVPGSGMHHHPTYRRKATGRSLLLQKGVHDIDLINWFVGSNPVSVSAQGNMALFGGDKPKGLTCVECPARETCRPKTRESIHVDYLDYTFPNRSVLCAYGEDVDMEDNYQVLIGYENGAKAVFTLIYGAPEYKHEFMIYGEKGRMDVHYDHRRDLYEIRIRTLDNEQEQRLINPLHTGGGHGGGDRRIIPDFLQAVAAKRQPRANLIAARNGAAVAAAAQDSIESGDVVALRLPGTIT